MEAMTSASMRWANVIAVLGMALAVSAAGARARQATGDWKAEGVRTANAGISSGSGSLCDSCIWILKTARCEASDPDAQAALISLALSEVCDKLGGELAAQCSQLVPQVLRDSNSATVAASTLSQQGAFNPFIDCVLADRWKDAKRTPLAAQLVPVAIMMLGSYSSRELCADMSLCSATTPQRLFSPQPLQLRASSGCSMCKYLAGRAGGALSLKQASLPPLLCPACWRLVVMCIAEALQAMRELSTVNVLSLTLSRPCLQACAELPAEFHAQCEALASSTGEQLALASSYCCSCSRAPCWYFAGICFC